MKSIVFYFDMPGLESIDFSTYLQGNPGIGGTEYEFLLVSQLLAKRGKVNCQLLSRTRMPSYIKSEYVNGIDDTIEYCKTNNADILVINQGQFEKINKKHNIPLIVWVHNEMSEAKMELLLNDDSVKRVVWCGREFMELHYDNLLMRKSTWIYNVIPIQSKLWYLDKIHFQDNHNVVYMGALIPEKGFHLLAMAWPKIVKAVPDAELYVLGSGQLYCRSEKMGKYGIAQQDYEESFMSYLPPPLQKSIHFMGVVSGDTKWEKLGLCKVGVPNPSGRTETFCLTALEMQLAGCSLCSIRHPAYLDTIFNQKYLYRNVSSLADYIIKRLLAPRDDYDSLYGFVSERFSPEISLKKWEALLADVKNTSIETCSNNNYHFKPLKSFLLKLKIFFPILGRYVPSVELMYNRGRICISKIVHIV